ncbi:hypothetical protein HMPREF9135_1001 [Segatella baroniae F0067]|uniref:Uncharacterized protein n=1 Tax=Segatella baroniae F0067 TaxID=1115809 RepID=U2P3B7_9BACT|nr:hypothetical protein HMPREF9135_1001 [Segatella baroniae F0067]
MRAGPPVIKGQPAATMDILSPLQLVLPHTLKGNWQFRRLTLYTQQHPPQT